VAWAGFEPGFLVQLTVGTELKLLSTSLWPCGEDWSKMLRMDGMVPFRLRMVEENEPKAEPWPKEGHADNLLTHIRVR
jgi:hypothetical protein